MALAAFSLLAAPALAAERNASAEDCAIIAQMAKSQFLNAKGVVPLHLQAHVPARPDEPATLRDIEGGDIGQYYRDYFPQLPVAETADLGAAAAHREGGFDAECDWKGLGLSFADNHNVLQFEQPVVSADDRYAIESGRYSSEAMGDGGADCLMEHRAGAWVVAVCRPTAGLRKPGE